MKTVNELVLCKDEYEDSFDFEEAIQNAIMLLLNAGYIMTVKYDDKNAGIVLIEYEYADVDYGCRYPYWLLPEESESVVWSENE